MALNQPQRLSPFSLRQGYLDSGPGLSVALSMITGAVSLAFLGFGLGYGSYYTALCNDTEQEIYDRFKKVTDKYNLVLVNAEQEKLAQVQLKSCEDILPQTYQHCNLLHRAHEKADQDHQKYFSEGENCPEKLLAVIPVAIIGIVWLATLTFLVIMIVVKKRERKVTLIASATFLAINIPAGVTLFVFLISVTSSGYPGCERNFEGDDYVNNRENTCYKNDTFKGSLLFFGLLFSGFTTLFLLWAVGLSRESRGVMMISQQQQQPVSQQPSAYLSSVPTSVQPSYHSQ